MICGREGAAVIPDGRPRPKPARALKPVLGGFGSGLGSRGGFIYEEGGYVLAALGLDVSSI